MDRLPSVDVHARRVAATPERVWEGVMKLVHSRLELAFEIEPGPDGVTVSAHTSAEFPGVAGRLYRAAVIGSGGHRFFVRRMLEQIAQFAERP